MEKRISGHTGLMALFGTPVGHSGSPAMYNFSFQHDGLDYAYMAFDVTEEEMKELLIYNGQAEGERDCRKAHSVMENIIKRAELSGETSGRLLSYQRIPDGIRKDGIRNSLRLDPSPARWISSTHRSSYR